MATEDSAINPAAEAADAPGADAADAMAATPAEAAEASQIDKHDKGKLVALIAIIVVLLILSVFLVKYFSQLSTAEGRQQLVAEIRGAGPWGVFILLALQIVQVIVAVVPGEVVEIVGGMIYGPWLGTLIIIVGVVIASAAIFMLVRKLGYPFVSKFVSQKHLDRFSWLTDAKKLGVLVFLLFLCPGLPKDTLSYIVPLTDMKMGHYLVLSTLGRLPGCLVLAFGGATFLEGNYKALVIIIVCAAVVAVLGIVFRKRIMDFFERRARKTS